MGTEITRGPLALSYLSIWLLNFGKIIEIAFSTVTQMMSTASLTLTATSLSSSLRCCWKQKPQDTPRLAHHGEREGEPESTFARLPEAVITTATLVQKLHTHTRPITTHPTPEGGVCVCVNVSPELSPSVHYACALQLMCSTLTDI